MDNTKADFDARREKRDQGSKDLCNSGYVRTMTAFVQQIQNNENLSGGRGPQK